MNAEHRNAVPANTAISRSWLRAFSDMPTTPQARTEFGRQEAPTPPSWASSFGIRIMLSTIQAVSSISIAHRTALQHHVVWESAVTNVLMSWPVSPGFVSGNPTEVGSTAANIKLRIGLLLYEVLAR